MLREGPSASAKRSEKPSADVEREIKPEAAGTSSVRLSPAEHDFGVVKVGEDLKLTLEVVRPEGTPLRLGRVYSSCSCVTVSAPKRVFKEDEPAAVFVTVKTAAQEGRQKYLVSVELLGEERTVLQATLFLTSE